MTIPASEILNGLSFLLAVGLFFVWLRDRRLRAREGEGGEAAALLEAKLRAVVDSLGEGFLISDLGDTVLYANNRMAELTGYPIEEMIGQASHQVLVPVQGRPVCLHRLKERAAGVAERHEARLRRKDGTFFWTEIRSTPFRDHYGSIAGTLHAFTDIGARKNAEEALSASEQRYRLLFERNLAGVYRTTPDGRVLDCNDACVRIFGFASREEALRCHLEDLYPDRVERERMLEALRMHKTITNYDIVMRGRDGRRLFVLLNATLIEADGQAPVIEGTLFDITERKVLEDQLRQAQKMEAVGQLAGGVAHDFNNLLTIINGYSQLVMAELRPGNSTRTRVAEVLKAGERAASLTRQLLAFSRHQAVEPEPVDLSVVLESLHSMLRRLIGEHIELSITPNPRAGLIKADPSQIEQVILNLAVNARDAMPSGGRLTIETELVDLEAAEARSYGLPRPGEYVILTVSDDGCGMDADTQTHAFEPFFTTKEPGRGTGLGLATVYGIVKRSEGTIRLESQPGQGTIFRIYLPRLDALSSCSEAACERVAASAGHAETILLAEDEIQVRRLVRSILEGRGYRVIEAGNGEEALAISDREGANIDLVLTDVIMPKMSGRELSEQLQRRHVGIPLIYMTGYSDTVLVPPSVRRQGAAFLMKPFAPEDLARAVRAALDAETPVVSKDEDAEYAASDSLPV